MFHKACESLDTYAESINILQMLAMASVSTELAQLYQNSLLKIVFFIYMVFFSTEGFLLVCNN